MTERDIFTEALNHPSGPGRAAFLDRACGGDTALRARVELLLSLHDSDRDALASPPTDLLREAAAGLPDDPRPYPGTADDPGTPAVPGTVLAGRYTLDERIGEGGMGEVWVARQTEPVKRKVAVKLIRAGVNSQAVLARFEQERQALAVLDHPNIARVLDGGVGPNGQPFFVMELVNGLPLTRFCDEAKLTPRERLGLFVPICQAVQHAHQKGIVHRDLKPANILVTVVDGRPVPKVIDFGVAKATGERLTDATLSTHFGAVVGTLEYMAPEQAGYSGVDVDTRADVYALGVILYELLTGLRPIDADRMRQAAMLEVIRIIREEEPARPSTRLSTADALPSLAALRQTDPRRLTALLRGELDWVVMKCLEKPRDRRYGSASDLARDVERFLANEPVEARPPSRLYRLRKFVRRNRVQVIAAGLVLLALVAGVVGTGVGLVRAESARRDAVAQRDKAERVAKFMAETLEGVTPEVARGRDVRVLKDMMDAAAARIEAGELEAAPEAELRLRLTVGTVYRRLSEYPAAGGMLEPAAELARRQHPGDHPDRAEAVEAVASLCKDRGDLAKAEPLYREALSMRQRLTPGDHPATADLTDNLALVLQLRDDYPAAEPLHRDALAMRRRLHPGDHKDVALSLGNLAELLRKRSEFGESERLHRDALAMRRRLYPGDHPMTAGSLINLAALARAQGDTKAAERHVREAVAMNRRLYPGDHDLTASALQQLGAIQFDRAEYKEAEKPFADALDMQRRLYPGDHPAVVVSLNNVAAARQYGGDPAGAEPVYLESVAMSRRLAPAGDLALATTLLNLAKLYHARGNAAGAETSAREALAIRRRRLDRDDAGTADVLNFLAIVHQNRKEYARAEEHYREALGVMRRLFHGDHPSVALYLVNLSSVLYLQGKLAEAEPLAREGVGMSERTNGQGHWLTGFFRGRLGRVLRGQKRYAEAEAELLSGHRLMSAAQGPTAKQLADCVLETADLYADWHRAEPGKGYDAKAAEWKAKLGDTGQEKKDPVK
jgi:serine/threonine protein kinase/tetratricopeptide (TPR) repeat protein